MKKEKAKKKMKILAKQEDNPIKTIKAVFPFDLYPDQIQIYRDKIVVIRKYFPFGVKEFPILLEDIKTVRVINGPFFSSMFFDVSGYETNPKPVAYLKKKEAIETRALITGLMQAEKEDVDTLKIKEEKLIEMAKKIG